MSIISFQNCNNRLGHKVCIKFPDCMSTSYFYILVETWPYSYLSDDIGKHFSVDIHLLSNIHYFKKYLSFVFVFDAETWFIVLVSMLLTADSRLPLSSNSLLVSISLETTEIISMHQHT